MLRVSVIGASGYTGLELIRLLAKHPKVSLAFLYSQQFSGKDIQECFPHLRLDKAMQFSHPSAEEVGQQSDLVFLALPHGESIAWIQALLPYACKIIDLSADMRLDSCTLYEQWYGKKSLPQSILDEAVYALPELTPHAHIQNARLVANPGCYPTASLLALAPALSSSYCKSEQTIFIDAKSGVSGAGKSPTSLTHFCEVAENMSAYSIGTHRHSPEIQQEINKLHSKHIGVHFVPHLIPLRRGMLASCYCYLDARLRQEDIYEMFIEYYKHSAFVLLRKDARPSIQAVIGTNSCHISLFWRQDIGLLTSISCIDNLLKGASGQAVQNMNIMYMLPEGLGLEGGGYYP